MRKLALVTLAAGLAACSTTPDAVEPEVDAVDEAFLGVEGSVAEDSAEARGVLLLVNATDEAQLREVVELAPVVVDSMVAYRRGPDGATATADDRQVASLAELDAIPFVGPRAFAQLLGFVQTSGVAGVVRLDDAHPHALAWSVSPASWVPEGGRLRVHVDKSASGEVALSFVGDSGTWFVFRGTMSATGHVEATLAQNVLQGLSDARVTLDPIYPDRFCASFTGSIDLGLGPATFALPFAARSAALADGAALACP